MNSSNMGSIQFKTPAKRFSHTYNILAVPFVAITVAILSYAGLFGFYPIILFFAMWFPFIFQRGFFTLHLSKDIYLLVTIACLFVASTLWSDYPSVTAKASLEAASMIACGIIIARAVSFDAFLEGITIGTAVVLIASLIKGTYAIDYFSGTPSLVGLFASKNQIGLTAEIGMFFSITLMFTKKNILKKILVYIPSFVICIICLYLSKSATSVISMIGGFFICGTIYLLTKFPKRMRKTILFVMIILGISFIILVIALNLQEAGLKLFGKDSSLTGRTLLWAEGIKAGLSNPIWGHGFNAFWVPGRPKAEELWYKFDIFNRIGFHFHDTFIEVFVELGVVGLALIVSIFVMNTISSLRYVIRNGSSVWGTFCLGLASILLIRAFVEVDVFGTFGFGELLFVVLTTYVGHKKILDSKDKKSKTKGFLIKDTHQVEV